MAKIFKKLALRENVLFSQFLGQDLGYGPTLWIPNFGLVVSVLKKVLKI